MRKAIKISTIFSGFCGADAGRASRGRKSAASHEAYKNSNGKQLLQSAVSRA